MDQGATYSSPSATYEPDPLDQFRSREEVKQETRDALRDGTIDRINSEHGYTAESPILPSEQ